MTAERREHRYQVTWADGTTEIVVALPAELRATVREAHDEEEWVLIIDETAVDEWIHGRRAA